MTCSCTPMDDRDTRHAAARSGVRRGLRRRRRVGITARRGCARALRERRATRTRASRARTAATASERHSSRSQRRRCATVMSPPGSVSAARDSGPNGSDQWLQVGLNAFHGTGSNLYYEVTTGGVRARYHEIAADVSPAHATASPCSRSRRGPTGGASGSTAKRSQPADPPARQQRPLPADRHGGDLGRRHA